MILKSIFVFVPAILAGFGLAHLFWDNIRLWALILKLFLGIGLGLGITSCLYFMRLLWFAGQGGYLFIQFGFLFIVIIALIVTRKIPFKPSFTLVHPSLIQILLGAVIVAVLLLAGRYALLSARISPHGDYDAQAIWNLRARFMYRLGSDWKNAFSSNINRNFHMDYPLLMPLNVVGAWNTLGGEVLRVPAMQSMLFLLAAAGVIFSALAYLRSTSQASVAVVILLGTPAFNRISAFQTADIPLSYFFLASIVLFVLAYHENSKGALLLAGLMSALSAWTKNEGVPFLIIVTLFMLLMIVSRQKWLGFVSFTLGMILPLATILLFKIYLPFTNDLFTHNGPSEIFAKISDPARYLVILKSLTYELWHLGEWPVSILAVLFIYCLIMGIAHYKNAAERSVFLILVAQFFVYILIYLITPNDLDWQLKYSANRLLLQIFPLMLLAYFLYVQTPDYLAP